MIEIASGLRAGMVREKKHGDVWFQISVTVADQTNSVWIDEQQMDALQSALLNAINAAQIVRDEREKHRKGQRWPARAR